MEKTPIGRAGEAVDGTDEEGRYRYATGRIEIRGLQCRGRHGAYPGEQDLPRELLVDVEISLDLEKAAREDDLAQTVDFAAVASSVRSVIGGPPRALLEALAADVAATILREFPVAREVAARVVKPNPPGLGAVEEAATVTLSRA